MSVILKDRAKTYIFKVIHNSVYGILLKNQDTTSRKNKRSSNDKDEKGGFCVSNTLNDPKRKKYKFFITLATFIEISFFQ